MGCDPRYVGLGRVSTVEAKGQAILDAVPALRPV
jgi:hypothetical protein